MMTAFSIPRYAALAVGAMLLGGCVVAPERPSWRYLQRPDVRVAIIPASNHTTKAGAQIVVDKAWEQSLLRAGFRVVDADSVVTYASSRGMPVGNLGKVPVDQLGRELKADYLLKNEIVDWGTRYQVIQSVAVVSCKSRLVEARTGASIWELDWIVTDQNNNNSGGGVAGLLANALVKAVMDSMVDAPTALARQGVGIASSTQPYPGVASRGMPVP